MNIEQLTDLVTKHRGLRPLQRYTTDVPDYRFGIPETYVAITFEQNGQSTVFEFRIGFINGMITKLNQLSGVNAVPHHTSQDMLIVTINNSAFNDDVNELLDDCTRKAVEKFFRQH